MDIPIVFISSTCEDLKKTGHRDAAKDAASIAGFLPQMQEYWGASGDLPLEACMEKVDKADVLVVIVAYRFGWIPQGQEEKEPDRQKSISWLECERAVQHNRDILAYVVAEGHDWPQELREEYRLMEAVQAGDLTPELTIDIQRRVNRLKAFKAWINERKIRARFTTVEDLRGKISVDLLKWCQRHGRLDVLRLKKSDPGKYLRQLREETSHIDIRGLQVESGRAQRFPIDDLYIPLRTTLSGESEKRGGPKQKGLAQRGTLQSAPIELHHALKQRLLVILGDPGSGKTTFLKRTAYGLCNTRLGIEAKTTAGTLGLKEGLLPLSIRISELAEHLSGCFGQQQGEPSTKASPAWLAHFLGAKNHDAGTGLDQAYFQQVLTEGSALVLLDGLDETPTRAARECISDLVTEAAQSFEACGFVVTTRPPAFEGRAILPGFTQVRIDPLEESAIEGFLTQWCQALFVGREKQARQHLDELFEALRSRGEIRGMARNPVMLTALAVVHWHEKRLPEQRADLYDSIIIWLSRARDRKEGRLAPETCVKHLWELALAMQDHPEGRQVQVARHWAAEQIAAGWPKALSQQQRIERAEQFLREEELDSGIVVGRGDDIRFWHLTFQEFLAARAIAARSEQDQRAILLSSESFKLYESNWREVVLLLAGVLFKQGSAKADGLVSSIIDRVWPNGTLTDQARCAGLLGAVVRDLRAVGFEPADPRYRDLLNNVMAIFDQRRNQGMDIKIAIEAAEALGQAGDPRFVDSALEDNWVDIPAGEFLMGAQDKEPSQPNYDPELDDDESPVHTVLLGAYRIGLYPVTVGEYAKFVESGGYDTEAHWHQGGFGEWKDPEDWETQQGHLNRPVVGVSWLEAAAYARWAGKALPTEAQWERAARGLQDRRFPWGNQDASPTLLNYGDSNIDCPTPVGVYPQGATPEGIQDMAGNVLEWCSDWWDKHYYSESPKEDPLGPDPGSSRVLRGGAWDYDPWGCRSSYRCSGAPTVRHGDFGFRLVSLSFGLGLPS